VLVPPKTWPCYVIQLSFPHPHSSPCNLSTLSSASSSTLFPFPTIGLAIQILNPYNTTNTNVSTVSGTSITRAPFVSRHARLLSAQLVSVINSTSSHATSSRVHVNVGLVKRPSELRQVVLA
jgi:hypothetical protein